MKKVFFALLITSCLATFANAQERQGNGGQRQRPTVEQQLKQYESLGLSDEQKSKITALLTERNEAFQNRGNTSVSQEERRATFQKQRTEFETKIKEVLTKEQIKKYEKLSVDRQDAGRTGSDRPSGERPSINQE